MKYLVDECTGPGVARWLEGQGHDVYSVYDQARGLADTEVIRKGCGDNRVIITCDKDFGELIIRHRHAHKGVVLLRLKDEKPANKIRILTGLLARHRHQLPNRFTVVTEKDIRITRW
jgi:predicted nuclease of predicted toxin-antitoxin system